MNLEPRGFVRVLHLEPHELITRITLQSKVFVLAHVGVPRIDPFSWTLELGGLIERPMSLSLAQIRDLPKRSVQSFHQCAGFPRRPDIATRRVANVEWSGADLRELLRQAGIDPRAKYLVSKGCDRGSYDGLAEADYIKDMPLDRLEQGDVLLAYEMNGEPLTPEHGFPVRLVIPGYYGTNSVKWLRRLDLHAERAQGVFTQELYNDPIDSLDPIHSIDSPNLSTRPVWAAGPEAIIVSPRNGAVVKEGLAEITGWAWGAQGIARVQISADGGACWQDAKLGDRAQWSWQWFSAQISLPANRELVIMARATDTTGVLQPMELARNSVHRVRIGLTSDAGFGTDSTAQNTPP